MGQIPGRLHEDIYFANPTSKMLLLGSALSNLKREGRIAWMWVTHSDMVRANAAEEDCEGIVNYGISIAGVEVAAFLRELPDHRVRLSLRSKGQVDVAEAAQHFGGGGHSGPADAPCRVHCTKRRTAFLRSCGRRSGTTFTTLYEPQVGARPILCQSDSLVPSASMVRESGKCVHPR